MAIRMAPCQELWRIESMDDIRRVFPTLDDVNDLNFMLFSTSGVHGSYASIEDVEAELSGGGDPDDGPPKLTVMILQPRCVTFGFGHISVEAGDIDYLKGIRARSRNAMMSLCEPDDDGAHNRAHIENAGETQSEPDTKAQQESASDAS
jgi:hypothetical protein